MSPYRQSMSINFKLHFSTSPASNASQIPSDQSENAETGIGSTKSSFSMRKRYNRNASHEADPVANDVREAYRTETLLLLRWRSIIFSYKSQLM